MDKITGKRKKKSRKQKNVLLSIVDPWDVKVASVNPFGLAKRRGVFVEDIEAASRPEVSSSQHVWPSSSSPVSIPSPWYKPTTCSSFHRGDHVNSSESKNARFSPEPWQRPWTPPTQSENKRSTGRTEAEVLLEPPETGNNGTPGETKNRQYDSAHEEHPGDNVTRETSAESDRSQPPNYSGRASFENEEKSSRLRAFYSPEIVFNCRNGFQHLSPKSKEILRSHAKKNAQRVKLIDHCQGPGPGHPANTPTSNRDFPANGKIYNLPLPGRRSSHDRARVSKIVNQLVHSRYGTSTTSELDGPLENGTAHRETTKNDNVLLNGKTNGFGKASKSPDEETRQRRVAPPNKISGSAPLKADKMDDARNDTQTSVTSKFSRIESDSSTTFSNSGSTPNGSTMGSETEEDANEEEMVKVPLQAPPRRKPRVVPSSGSHKFGADGSDIPDVQSPNSTITSVNSISSLLKEKLQLSIPQALRSSKKRQDADYKLRAFVGILFLCVVFLVGFAHVYYTQHVLQRAYFERFRFNKNERLLHVYSSIGAEIIAARLGLGIPEETGVFPCLPHHQRQDKVCLEWLGQTRLYLAHSVRNEMHCYHVTWQSLSSFFNPKDCFDWSPKQGHWYGAGQIQSMAYPLGQGKLESSPFITGDIRKHPFGNVLKRYFLNSKGATIVVDPESPLYVSINANRSKEFCLEAKHDVFAYINHLTPLPQLNYTICATDNMKSLHSSMAEKSLWDGLKPEELQAVHTLLSEPVWQISPTDEAAIYNYTEDVIALGFLRQGHVLLNEEWQPNPGDFVLDENRFPSMEETINVIHRRGFKIVFTIQPFISTESINFKDAVANRLLISERGSDPRIPALTRYRQSNSAGVLDITNNKTLPWLQNKLENLIKRYDVDSFYLDLGTAQDMPHYYKCEKPLINPDHYKTIFTNSILGAVSVIGVSSAISRPRAPVFVSLPPFPSSWKAIKTVIPTILSYGMIGYPFIMPGSVGGDVALPMSDNNPANDYEVNLPDKELYVRWLQLSTFLPVIRFTHLPSKYSDETVLEMAKKLTELRQKTVTPLLKKYANETLDTGLPIIRPLWMLDPADSACHVVVDEFSVGEELIVAPVLYSGSRQREVYLPAGVWKDGIDGSLRKGSRWIHNYRVTEDKIAYFVKMPDNTRF
ncbi:uncharacterized protein [Venturia canescens]|uniref:uncharacterized protein isoform X2 n=1 Tax=Venturia canescens TaxID=32260 RepID=UPI001C9CA731|nr:uncharacterized protein LOC122416259 isoform X2 [Venturia canescens]